MKLDETKKRKVQINLKTMKRKEKKKHFGKEKTKKQKTMRNRVKKSARKNLENFSYN